MLPLAGAFDVVVDGAAISARGTPSLLAGPTDFLYAPPGTAISREPRGGRFAVSHRPRRTAISRSLRAGAGRRRRAPRRWRLSREVRNFAAADAFDADRLIAVEVLTPGGNWASYPPHKHDEARDDETELEEIYYYVVPEARGPGLAYQQSTAHRTGRSMS